MNAGAALSPPFHWQSSAPSPRLPHNSRRRGTEPATEPRAEGRPSNTGTREAPCARMQATATRTANGATSFIRSDTNSNMPSSRLSRAGHAISPNRPAAGTANAPSAAQIAPYSRARRAKAENTASAAKRRLHKRKTASPAAMLLKSKKHIKKNWLIISSRRCEQIS